MAPDVGQTRLICAKFRSVHTTPTERNKAVVRAFVAAVNARDWEGLASR
jgi:hypothetical protein